MDPGQLEEDPSQPKENNKRKLSRGFDTSFKVTRVCLNARKQTYLLKLVKPDLQCKVDADNEDAYPTVCLKEDSADNEYAFRIMHDLNHKNILSMKVLCENKLKSNDTTSVATFVEPYEGLLWSICNLEQSADRINHIPSSKLQNYLRQIVMGLHFLRKNDLYHGNLSWDSTLYHGNTVKLADFRSKEPMSKAEAQWDDWLCFLKMLERVSNRAAQANQSSPEDSRYFCGNLDSLINMLKTLDRTSLPTIKDTVVEHIFFWDLARRLKFFSHTISLKLSDGKFMERVSKSGIRGKSWDTNCELDFRDLVVKMNDYREDQKRKSRKDRKEKAHKDENWEAYNGDSLEDYVRLICGACSHWRQLKLDVDSFIRENHPTVYGDVKNILETSDSEDSSKDTSQSLVQDSSKHTNQSGGYSPQGYRPQGHGAAFQWGPHSQSQPGYEYPPRGMPPPQNYNPPYGGHPQQGPPRGGMGRDQRQDPLPHLSYQGGGSDYYKQGSQPYDSQPPSYPPGPGNYNCYGQSQAPGCGQPLYLQHGPQQNYGHGYGVPRYGAPPPNQYYGQPQMAPQQGYPQQPDPYARPPYSGPGQWAPRGAPASYSFYQAPPPASYGPPSQQPPGQTYGAVTGPYGCAQQGYPQQGWQSPVPYGQRALVAPGYPQQGMQYPRTQLAYSDQSAQANANYNYQGAPAHPNYGSAYLHSGYGPTAPATGQAGYPSAPAAGEHAHGQAGYTQPPTNPPSYDQSAAAPIQSGYTAPAANP